MIGGIVVVMPFQIMDGFSVMVPVISVVDRVVIHLSIVMYWLLFPVLIVVVTVLNLVWGNFRVDVVSWFSIVSSMSAEVMALVTGVIKVAIKILFVSEVMGGCNRLVVAESVFIIPVDVASMPGRVMALFDGLLNVESSIVIVILSVVTWMFITNFSNNWSMVISMLTLIIVVTMPISSVVLIVKIRSINNLIVCDIMIHRVEILSVV